MKKAKTLLPLAALALALGLAACNGPQPGGDESSAAPGTSVAASSVAKPKITISAEGDKKTLIVEETVQLTAKEGETALTGVEWKSSNEAVATVDQTGKVTAVGPGDASISATKEGYNKGSISIKVNRPAALATLHFEDADHYAADGWWGTAAEGWEPTYARTEGNASDQQCIAHLDAGDKETLTFTSSAAIKAELVIMMASSDGVTDMSTVMGVKLNNAEIAMTGKALASTGDNNTFKEFSLGEQNLIAGDNVLELSFLASAPYIDDLMFYSKQQSTIAVKAAPAKERIEVQLEAEATGITAYIGEDTQITLTKPTDTTGVSYASDKETVATVDDTGKIHGVALGTANITIKKDGMYSARVAVTVEKKVLAGEIRVEAESAADIGSFHSYTDRTSGIQNGHSGGAYITGYDVTGPFTLNYTFESPTAQQMTLVIAGASHYQMSEDFVFGVDGIIKLNDQVVTPASEAKIESNQQMGAPTVEVTIGTVNVLAGTNTFAIEFPERAPALDCFRFLPIA